MPEYGYSTPYRGMSGGPLPPGALEAMTAPGRNIGRGIEQFGEGIGAMIQRYQQTKAEKEYATGEFEGLIAQYIPQAKDLPSGETGGVDMGFLGKIVGEKNVKKFVEGKASTADILAMTHSIKTAQVEKDKALARQLEGLQIDQIKQNLANQQREQASRDAFTKTMAFAGNIPDTVSKEVQTTEMVPQGSQQLRSVVAGYMDKARATVPAFNAAVMQASQQNGWPTELQANAPAMANAAQALTAMPKTQALPTAPVTTTSTVETPAKYEDQRKALANYALSIGAAPETFAALDQILQIAGKRPAQVVQSGKTPEGATWINVNGKTEIFAPPKIEGKELNGEQGKALAFAGRMALNEATINEVIKRGYEPNYSGHIPFLPERLKSESRKIYEAAKGNWIEAVLRRNSGAVISEKDYADAEQQYFPQPGESKEAIAKKKARRDAELESMKTAIGKHADEYLQKAIGDASKAPGQSQLPRVVFNPALAK